MSVRRGRTGWRGRRIGNELGISAQAARQRHDFDEAPS
jgi:hypothetical protein